MSVLRKITWAVQVFPFVYTVLYIAVYTFYTFSPEVVADLLDATFYVSPIVIVAHLLYSRILHLCHWHRIACALPLIPQTVLYIDTYFHEFTQQEILYFNLSVVLTAVLYLVAVYKVFFTDDGRLC